jgi:hypothetical protein
VVLVVKTQQDLSNGQADQFGVGHVFGVSRSGPGALVLGGDDAIV